MCAFDMNTHNNLGINSFYFVCGCFNFSVYRNKEDLNQVKTHLISLSQNKLQPIPGNFSEETSNAASEQTWAGNFQFCFLDNLVLSAELLMLIGHGKEFLKLIFQVLALHQSEYDGLKLKTSVFMAAKYIINSAD